MTARKGTVPVLAAAALALLAGGCGTPSSDLWAVERDGVLPDARLQLVVGDGGVMLCDGREEDLQDDDLLLDARQLEKDLAPLMADDLRLPARPGAQLRYRVVSDEGEVHFADNSPNLPPTLGKLIQVTRAIAMKACETDR